MQCCRERAWLCADLACPFSRPFSCRPTLERYEVVPPNIQQEIITKNKVAA